MDGKAGRHGARGSHGDNTLAGDLAQGREATAPRGPREGDGPSLTAQRGRGR